MSIYVFIACRRSSARPQKGYCSHRKTGCATLYMRLQLITLLLLPGCWTLHGIPQTLPRKYCKLHQSIALLSSNTAALTSVL